MTRSTQRLGVLHPGAPPAEIAAVRASNLDLYGPWPLDRSGD
jgi:hypothetical protein